MTAACTNCEEPIEGVPVREGDSLYCCAGCLDGGPCVCTHGTGSDDIVDANAGGNAPEPLTWRALKDVASTERPMILRVSGLDTQLHLLQLAHALEMQPEIADLALVRTNQQDAWFTVTVRNQETLAETLIHIPGFDVDARPHAAGVDALVRRAPEPIQQPAADGTERAGSRRAVGSGTATPRPWRPRLWELRWRLPAARDRDLEAVEVPTGASTSSEETEGWQSLVVYPFRSVAVLNLFQDSVRALDGVQSLRVRRFFRGTLHLDVEYDSSTPFIERLSELQQFSWRLMSTSPTKIEITIVGHGDLAAGG